MICSKVVGEHRSGKVALIQLFRYASAQCLVAPSCVDMRGFRDENPDPWIKTGIIRVRPHFCALGDRFGRTASTTIVTHWIDRVFCLLQSGSLPSWHWPVTPWSQRVRQWRAFGSGANAGRRRFGDRDSIPYPRVSSIRPMRFDGLVSRKLPSIEATGSRLFRTIAKPCETS
jgi:hypothetical protein